MVDFERGGILYRIFGNVYVECHHLKFNQVIFQLILPRFSELAIEDVVK